MFGTFKQAVQRLEHWRNHPTDCFSDHLYTLIAKADDENRERLQNGFPHEVRAYQEWKHVGDNIFLNLGDM